MQRQKTLYETFNEKEISEEESHRKTSQGNGEKTPLNYLN